MKHLTFVFLTLLLSVARAFALPHILVIQADDLPRFEFQIGLAYHLLPNIEALVNQGVDFKKFMISSPVCAPSRATFLSGQYPANHNVHCNSGSCVGGFPGSVTAFDHSNTLATWLQAAGYRTGHFGKWLNDYGSNSSAPPSSPLNPTYVPPGWTTWQALVDPTTYYSYGYKINDNGTVVQYGTGAADHQTSVLSTRAANWVTANHSAAPLFVYLTPVAPHSTYDLMLCAPTGAYPDTWCFINLPDIRKYGTPAWTTIASMPFYPGGASYPAFNEADISDKPSTLNWMPLLTATDITNAGKQFRARLQAMLSIDDMVGQVKAAFGTDPVYIMFTSDNGQMQGWHRRGDKQVAFDPSIFVPLIVTGPGVVHAALEHLVLNQDMTSTILALSGATAGRVQDGRSFLPLLQGQLPAWRKRAKVEHWQIPGSILDIARFAAVRTGATDTLPSRLYVEWPETSECELYDSNTDAPQNVNVCASRPTEVSTLQTLLNALKTCAGSSCVSAEN